ncbi:efflux RND transporter permease subunit, partial [bacterium]|nr:efflux RND transporter permease subunit [bacterium]
IMFKQMAFVIILALLASLATALILIPMLSSKLLYHGKEEKGPLSRLYKRSERWFGIVEERYKVLLGWALENRKKVILGGAALLLSSFLLFPLVGTRFMPEQDAGLFMTNIELPIGTRMEETGKVVKAIGEIFFREVPETEASFARWGYQEAGFRSPIIRDEGSHIGMAVTKLVPIRERKRSSREIVESLRPLLTSFPGAEVRFSIEDPMAGLLFGGGKPLTIEVWGYDLDVGRELARKVTKIIEGIEGVTDVEISRKEGKPELQIVVDREKASRLGLNVSAIGNTIKNLVSGKKATQYRERGREYDISVRLREEDRSQIEDLEKIFVISPSGKQIRLSNVASIREEIGPVKIERRDQQRIIKVMGNIYGRDLGSIVREAKEKLERLTIPASFFIKFSGEREEQEKSFRNLLFALILGAILVYMVMASQFESLRDPFIILFSIPFAMIGVIWALLITNQIFTVDAFIGLIMLVGIVVNNAIVLISYINILRRRGYTVREAVTIGGKTRLRPVLMTTITTVFGLLPLALLRGEGSEFWRPFGITIIGGLIVSTLITLIFVPTLYSIFEDRHKVKVSR